MTPRALHRGGLGATELPPLAEEQHSPPVCRDSALCSPRAEGTGEAGEGEATGFPAPQTNAVPHKPGGIHWQQHNGEGVVGVVVDPGDGALSSREKARTPAAASPPPPEATPSEAEIQEAEVLQQRMLHSVQFPRLEPDFLPADATAKRLDWQYGTGPVPSLEGVMLPRRHRRDKPAVTRRSLDPSFFQSTRQAARDHEHESEMCYVCYQRSRLEQDPSIQATQRAQQAEAEAQTHRTALVQVR